MYEKIKRLDHLLLRSFLSADFFEGKLRSQTRLSFAFAADSGQIAAAICAT